MKEKLYFFIGLILTVSLLWPLLAAPFFTHHDDVQIIRLFEMNKCFEDGQIPCRWVPDLGGLYGYPLFNFYAPLPYYFGEIVLLLTKNIFLSVKLMFAIPFIGAYIFMYLLGKKIWGEMGGSLSAIFYSLAPYHAVVFYVRGAMGELWSLMFFPALLWSLLKLKESLNLGISLLVALFLALSILSHNLSTMIFMPIFLGWAFLLFFQRKDFKFIKLLSFSLVLGLFLSAFYLLPMLFEKNLVHVETTTGGYFSYTEHFKGLRKLFLDFSWGWGASVREVPGGERDGMSFQIGWVHVLGLILALWGLRKLIKTHKQIMLPLLFSVFIVFLSIFMINPRSEFIWKSIEPLKYLQFPWRFLMLIIFFSSFVSGSVFLWLNKKYQQKVWWGLVLLVTVSNFLYFRPEKLLDLKESDLFSGERWDKQIKRSIFDFLPIYAKEPPAELATERYSVIVGQTNVSSFKEGTNWINFKADTKEHTIIRMSQYYFPNWEVIVDGQKVPIDYSSGFITFILGKGQHSIEAKLLDTSIRSVSNILSFTAILFFLLSIPTQIPFTRKWLSYYVKFFGR